MALHVHCNCTIGKSRAVEVVAMRVYDRPLECVKSIYHIPRRLHGNEWIKCTVEIPDRHTGATGGIGSVYSAAHRNCGRESFRETDDELPRPVSSHGEACDVKPVRVDGKLTGQRIEYIVCYRQFRADGERGVRAPSPNHRALRRDDKTGVECLVRGIGPRGGDPVVRDLCEVVGPSLSGPVQAQNEGVAFGA